MVAAASTSNGSFVPAIVFGVLIVPACVGAFFLFLLHARNQERPLYRADITKFENPSELIHSIKKVFFCKTETEPDVVSASRLITAAKESFQMSGIVELSQGLLHLEAYHDSHGGSFLK